MITIIIIIITADRESRGLLGVAVGSRRRHVVAISRGRGELTGMLWEAAGGGDACLLMRVHSHTISAASGGGAAAAAADSATSLLLLLLLLSTTDCYTILYQDMVWHTIMILIVCVKHMHQSLTAHFDQSMPE